MGTTDQKAKRFVNNSEKTRDVNGEKNVRSTARRSSSQQQVPQGASTTPPLKGPGV